MDPKYTGPLALLCDACGEPVANDDHHFDPPVRVGCDNVMTYTQPQYVTEDRHSRVESAMRREVIDPVEDSPL